MSTQKFLQEMRVLLASPGSWIQRHFARTADNAICVATHLSIALRLLSNEDGLVRNVPPVREQARLNKAISIEVAWIVLAQVRSTYND